MKFKKFKKIIFLFIRLSLSFGILFYLFRKTDYQKLRQIILQIVPYYYLLALICVGVFQALVAFRWQKICESWNFKSSYFYFLKSYLMGFSLNAVFPGIVAGDTLRAYHLIKAGLNIKQAIFSVFLDRILGLFGILLILSFSLPIMSDFLPISLKKFLIYITYSFIFVFILLIFLSKKALNFYFFRPLMPPWIFVPLFLGLVIQTLYVVHFIFLSFALKINIDYGYFFVVIPIVSFLNALPISISGLGIREGTLSYFLFLLNYPIEYGLSLGLLSYTLILISSLPGIVLYVFPRFRDYRQ